MHGRMIFRHSPTFSDFIALPWLWVPPFVGRGSCGVFEQWQIRVVYWAEKHTIFVLRIVIYQQGNCKISKLKMFYCLQEERQSVSSENDSDIFWLSSRSIVSELSGSIDSHKVSLFIRKRRQALGLPGLRPYIPPGHINLTAQKSDSLHHRWLSLPAEAFLGGTAFRLLKWSIVWLMIS